MKTEVLGVARSNITVKARSPVAKPFRRPPQPVADLVDKIKAVIREMPTYGYRRVWAVLWRATKAQGLQPPNHKTHLSGHKNSRSSAAMLCWRC